jgi:hypothetical protein
MLIPACNCYPRVNKKDPARVLTELMPVVDVKYLDQDYDECYYPLPARYCPACGVAFREVPPGFRPSLTCPAGWCKPCNN